MIYGTKILVSDRVGPDEILKKASDLFNFFDEMQLLFEAVYYLGRMWVRYEQRVDLGLAPLDIYNVEKPASDSERERAIAGNFAPPVAPWLWENVKHCWPPLAVAKAAEIMADLMEQRHPAVMPSYDTVEDEYLAGFDEESQAPARAGFPAYIGDLFRDFAELCRRLDAAGAERLTMIADEESFSTTRFRIVT